MSKKKLFVPAVLIFIVPAVLIFTRFLGAPVAHAQTQQCYTLASLQGQWTSVFHYSGDIATGFGVSTHDGNGNFTTTFTVNEPTAGSTTGARTIVTGTATGTDTINCNGTGQDTHTTTTSTGSVSTAVDDFIITGAIVQNGQLVATSFANAQETPSAVVPGGVLLTRTYTRLPIYY